MAKELRCNLNSPVARDFLIQKILSTYENTLLVLKSGESARQATALPVFSHLDSSISPGISLSTEFEFDQNIIYREDQTIVSRNRNGSTLFEEAINGKPKHACYNDTQSATTLQPSPSPERHEIKPTSSYLSESMFSDTLSNLKTNLNVNTYDLNGATVPYSCSFPSTQFGFMEEYQQLQFPYNFDDELLQVLSPTLISPDTSGSHNITDWDSSPSFDFTVDQDDSDHYFKLQSH
ncbi:hypothetical protein Tco_1137486 [Tanacetum coccineum]